MFFYFEIDGKHISLEFIEPYSFDTNTTTKKKYYTIEIEDFNLVIDIESNNPKLASYVYYIEDEPTEHEIMVKHLLTYFVDLDHYTLIDEPDVVFISEKE